jgi:ABC-type nitrate/sulfonate/bicarbonate transport system substrate-binding protein
LRLVGLALAATLSVLVTGCGGNVSGDNAGGGDGLGTLRVVSVVPNSLLFIGVQAAERLGTWEGTGLTVEHIQGSSTTAGKIMASGEAEIGLTDGIRAMANIAQGLPATLVGSCYSPWAQLIIAGLHTGADSVEDLKGANFGISGEGSGGHYSTVKLAESLEWSEDDYTVTPLGDVNALTAALQSGAIDAFAWSSTTAFDLEERGIGKVLSPTDEIVGPNVFEIFSVMDETLKQRPEAVRVFFEGYYDAIERLQKDPELAVDILVQDWDVNPAAAQRAVELELPQLSTDGSISDEQLDGVAEAAEFATGTGVGNPGVSYTYWRDITA